MANNEKKQATPKKRMVVSYDNMSPELLAAFKEKYPKGYADYLGDIFKVEKPNGDCFYAVYLEIPEAVYLVKIDVNMDDYSNAEDDLFSGNDGDDGDEGDGDNTFPDEGNDMSGDDEQMDD